jgi:hypothetical protein
MRENSVMARKTNGFFSTETHPVQAAQHETYLQALLFCTLNISARSVPGASSRHQGNECTEGRVPSCPKSGAEKIDHGLAGIFVTDG